MDITAVSRYPDHDKYCDHIPKASSDLYLEELYDHSLQVLRDLEPETSLIHDHEASHDHIREASS